MPSFALLLGRVFLSAIFIISAYTKIVDLPGTEAYMASKGMPATGFFLLGSILLELGGGLFVLFGYKTRWGALALILFLIPTTLIFHTDFSDRIQTIMFLKNLAILGGLIFVSEHGPGKLSADAHQVKTHKVAIPSS